MQPYVFPYLGYFQLIHAVDTFVFYDDVHFKKKGFINRNSILLNDKSMMFTIPCKGISQNKLIKDIELKFDTKERLKFLSKIKHCYSKSPYYKNVYKFLESFVLNSEAYFISEFAIESIELITRYLELNTTFKKSSEYYLKSQGMEKTKRLIEISKSENAESYINPIGGKPLYSKAIFNQHGIDLYFLKSDSILYKQYDNKFVPDLSIIDLLMFNSVDEIKVYLNAYMLK